MTQQRQLESWIEWVRVMRQSRVWIETNDNVKGTRVATKPTTNTTSKKVIIPPCNIEVKRYRHRYVHDVFFLPRQSRQSHQHIYNTRSKVCMKKKGKSKSWTDKQRADFTIAYWHKHHHKSTHQQPHTHTHTQQQQQPNNQTTKQPNTYPLFLNWMGLSSCIRPPPSQTESSATWHNYPVHSTHSKWHTQLSWRTTEKSSQSCQFQCNWKLKDR